MYPVDMRGVALAAVFMACTSTSAPVVPGPAGAQARASEPAPSGSGAPVRTVTLRQRVSLASGPEALAWSHDGTRVVIGDDAGAARIVDAGTGATVQALGPFARRVTAIAASRSRVAVAASTELRTWTLANGGPGRELSGHEDLIVDLGFVGEALLAVDLRDTLRRWDPGGGAVVTAVPTLHALSLALAPGGETLAIGGYGEVSLIEVGSGVRRFKLGMPRCSEAPADPLCAEWRTVQIEEFPAEPGGRPGFYTTESPNWQVSDIVFSADGTRLAFGRADGVAVVVDAATGEPIARFAAGVDRRAVVALTRDGGTLAIGDQDGWIAVWDVGARREIRVAQGPGEGVGCLAFSPDDSALAVCGPGHSLTIWAIGR